MNRFPDPYIEDQKPVQYSLRPLMFVAYGIWFFAVYYVAAAML